MSGGVGIVKGNIVLFGLIQNKIMSDLLVCRPLGKCVRIALGVLVLESRGHCLMGASDNQIVLRLYRRVSSSSECPRRPAERCLKTSTLPPTSPQNSQNAVHTDDENSGTHMLQHVRGGLGCKTAQRLGCGFPMRSRQGVDDVTWLCNRDPIASGRIKRWYFCAIVQQFHSSRLASSAQGKPSKALRARRERL